MTLQHTGFVLEVVMNLQILVRRPPPPLALTLIRHSLVWLIIVIFSTRFGKVAMAKITKESRVYLYVKHIFSEATSISREWNINKKINSVDFPSLLTGEHLFYWSQITNLMRQMLCCRTIWEVDCENCLE